jgi:lipoic acid synthetase
MRGTGAHLGVRWLGRVPYTDAWALQRGFHRQAVLAEEPVERLLLLEHEHVYTLGRNADSANVLVDPASVGAELLEVDRGGDVTYHGPGQLVAYPLVKLPTAQVRSFVCLLEDVLVATLADFGISNAGRQDDYPGVWIDPGTPSARKIAAVGIRVEKGRTLHGIALNVDPNMEMFSHIVPCGITDYGVVSMAELLPGEGATMEHVTNSFVGHFVNRWEPGGIDRADVVWRHRADSSDLSLFSRGHGAGERTDGSNNSVAESAAARRDRPDSGGGTSVRLKGRLAEAGVAQGISISERKPDWMRARVTHSPKAMRTRRTVADLNLVTVCEEAGCPNLSECWSDGTATFMVNGERCTRACGFCLVDTRKPMPPEETEPDRVAEAVARMGLDFAVVTTVARDDLPDEGAGQIAATIRAIRRRNPGVSVEVLISDCRGRSDALDLIFNERPDVMNHNMETVPRLQRAVRPSASYARSLSVLARSVKAGLVTKSGLVLGMGETREEISSTLADLAAVGVSIVTIGQYLRPTTHHLPVANWWTPEDYDGFKEIGESLGIGHVESSPFTRSSYHAKAAAEA